MKSIVSAYKLATETMQKSLKAASEFKPWESEKFEKLAERYSAAARYLQTELAVYIHYRTCDGTTPASDAYWVDEKPTWVGLEFFADSNFAKREADLADGKTEVAPIFINQGGINPPNRYDFQTLGCWIYSRRRSLGCKGTGRINREGRGCGGCSFCSISSSRKRRSETWWGIGRGGDEEYR